MFQVFSIALNGETVIPDLDIYAAVGRGVAHQEMVPFTLTGRSIKFADGTKSTLPGHSRSVLVEFVKVMLCFVQVMLCFVQVMLCFVQVMLCSVQVMLCFVQVMLCSVQVMLCSVKVMNVLCS